MPPLVIDSAKSSRRFTREFVPRAERFPDLVNGALLPAINALKSEYPQLMLDVAEGGPLEDYAEYMNELNPPAVQVKVAEAFALFDAGVAKLYEINAISPDLLELPDLPE